jgi:hypothetical protein
MIAVAVGICSRRRRCLSAQFLAAAIRGRRVIYLPAASRV